MTVGLIVLTASVVVIFAVGVLTGYRLSERKLASRARRQAAAQSSLYRQLRELQAASQANYGPRRNMGAFP
jgi:hypothetical protein